MPKAPKAEALTDEILAAAAAASRSPKTWFSSLPPEWQEKVLAARESFRADRAGMTKSAWAKGIEAVLKRRRLVKVRWPEIAKWLDAGA